MSAAAGGTSSPRFAFFERIGDRLNPILVKEVRQTLRGRYFRVSFWFTLCAASVFSMGGLVFRVGASNAGQQLGIDFYGPSIACLLLATHAFVPFSAFVAMGSEWDENTYDMLVLSNLRPRQIVLGKVLAACVQASLFYSAFVPFLVFAFLLRGVDLLALLVTVGGSMVICFALCCLSVAASSLARARFPRILIMAGLGTFLVWVPGIMGGIAANAVMRFPGNLHTPEAVPWMVAMATVALAAGILFLLIGGARLAHPEENRSTGLRIYALVFPVMALTWVGYLSLRFDNGLRSEENLIFTVMGLIFVAAAALFFITEPEELGRRVRQHIPRRRGLAILAVPFLPGGGRGLIWYLLASSMVIGWSFGMEALTMYADSRYSGLDAVEAQASFTTVCYCLVYLGLPSLIFSRWTREARMRGMARITVLLFVIASVFLPALIGFILGEHDWMRFYHPGNAALVIGELVDGRGIRVPLAIGIARIAAIAVLVASIPRLYDGAREVLLGRRPERKPAAAPDVPPISGGAV